MTKITFLFQIFSLLIIHRLFAQQGVSVISFPKEKHFYQRNTNNKAIVNIVGLTENSIIKSISLLIKKDKQTVFYNKSTLVFSNNTANFNFQPEIIAELANYNFSLYAHTDKDSLLITKAQNILCGESIIIYGQSNAEANIDVYNDSFNSIFGRTYYIDFASDKEEWADFDHPYYYAKTGSMGIELQRLIIDKYKIPVAIINGAVGGMGITDLSFRDLGKNGIYGRLYITLKNSGFIDKSKIFLWRQGEREGWDKDIAYEYAFYFDKLYTQIQSDFSAIKYFYNFQNNLLPAQNPKAGDIREFQRQTRYKYPNIRTIGTVGTAYYDGLHYFVKGYQESAREVFKMIENDFFLTSKKVDVISPDIQKAFFNNTKDTLILKFDSLQVMKYPKNVINVEIGSRKTYKLTDMLFLDQKPIEADTGFVKNNSIYFPLKSISNAKTVTYMPDFWKDIDIHTKLPILTNSYEQKALTFKNFPVIVLPKQILLANSEDLFQNITIQPNPVKKGDLLKIASKNELNITSINIFNIFGEKLDSTELYLETKEVSTENFTSGLYFVEINFQGKRIIKKFIVE